MNNFFRLSTTPTVSSILFILTIILTPIHVPEAVLASQSSPENKVYTRIISLYSAHTENLATLGAAEQLIGISSSDNYPPTILDKKRYSYREDPERFIAAAPDLVLIRPMIERSYPQFIAKLRQANIAVISLQPTSMDTLFDYWIELGSLSGRAMEAERMIEKFKGGLAAMEQQISTIPYQERPGVYFESMHRKMKTFAPSSITLFALNQAGGRNIATDAKQVRNTNIAAYSKERILAHANDIDIFIAQRGRMNPVKIETIRNETGFAAIKAIRENNIMLIDEHLVSRPTMRLLEGIQLLHDHIYPDGIRGGEKP